MPSPLPDIAIFATAAEAGLDSRIAAAFAERAADVLKQARLSDAVAEVQVTESRRRIFARRVLANPTSVAQGSRWALAAGLPALVTLYKAQGAGGITDDNLRAAVAAVWDALAEV